jgi:hypothetical protein
VVDAAWARYNDGLMAARRTASLGRADDAGDPTIYPTEERVGEEALQRFIVELLRPLVERWLASRRQRAFVGADLFIYYRKHDPHQRVAPDVFVLPGVEPGSAPTSWKTWLKGVIPSLAVEVAARDGDKDYTEAPGRYAELGVTELIIFDPHHRLADWRSRWQVYRRSRGKLHRLTTSDEDRVKSRVLGCFLRVVGQGERQRLRLGTGESGDELFPTEAEAERAAKEAERAAKEAERAAKEAERAAKEAERAAKEAEREEKEAERRARLEAEAEVARLRELLGHRKP